MGMDRKTFLRITGCTLAGALAGDKVAGVAAEARDETTAPAPGALTARRWAMVVDTRKCRKEEGCDKCIRACHEAHNVPVIPDPKHEIKWIWKEPFEHAFPSQQSEYLQEKLEAAPALVFCNHCEEPPCVRVCPTQATWKRESDGIVMMDWHRCIGDPRTYLRELNPDFPTRTKGVVEKCTFCEERLAVGKPPACVEACPEKALVFGDLDDPNSEVRRLLREEFTLRRKPELGTKPQVFYIL